MSYSMVSAVQLLIIITYVLKAHKKKQSITSLLGTYGLGRLASLGANTICIHYMAYKLVDT